MSNKLASQTLQLILGEILRRKADDWVRGCLLDDVWGRILELEEVKMCVLVQEADWNGEEMLPPAPPVMAIDGPVSNVQKRKNKKPKPFSK